MATPKKFDTMQAGLLPGLLLPLLTLVLIWLIRYDGGLLEFLSDFQSMRMLSKVISLCALPNLLLFFICIWTQRNFAARGVIMATLVVAALMLILKFA